MLLRRWKKSVKRRVPSEEGRRRRSVDGRREMGSRRSGVLSLKRRDDGRQG